jgi:acetone carboxylase gamma subunit|tara:strand:+ start:264 stop:599 length:336 start_codon:yes stop_codon:yes gene_type:complete
MKLTKLANLIYEVLEENQEARNHDDVLIFEVWNRLTPIDRNIWEVPMGDFFFILKNKWKLPNEQSIRRTRRKVQEHYPETRGTKYINRKARQENVKSNLRLVAAESTNPNY